MWLSLSLRSNAHKNTNTNDKLQIGEEKMDSNAVSPMYGGGRVTHHNNWSQDEEFAYNKAWAGVNFINVLCAHFFSKVFSAAFLCLEFGFERTFVR